LRAYVLPGPGQIELADVAEPACWPDQVVLETEAVSICSTDISYFRGHLSPDRWPVIPGHEYVGRVVEVGAEHRGSVRIGDRMTYWGQTDFDGLAEFRSISPLFADGRGPAESTWYTPRGFLDACQAAAVLLPPDMPAAQATLLEPVTSVLRSILLNPPRPGDVAVVLGCGPTGLIATQVLRRCFGVGVMAVLDRDPARLAVATDLGCDLAFDPATEASAVAALAEEHHGAFADYVFDALPFVDQAGTGGSVRSAAMGLLKAGGSYVIFGATDKPQAFDHWLVLAKGLRVRAAAFDVRAFPMSRTAHVAQVAVNLVTHGLLDVDRLTTGHVSFHDDAAVRGVFRDYGQAGALRTSIGFGAAAPGPASAELAELVPERAAELSRAH
jgi:threonine dehydrogenase-like Zn-dependent dehydrogenase